MDSLPLGPVQRFFRFITGDDDISPKARFIRDVVVYDLILGGIITGLFVWNLTLHEKEHWYVEAGIFASVSLAIHVIRSLRHVPETQIYEAYHQIFSNNSAAKTERGLINRRLLRVMRSVAQDISLSDRSDLPWTPEDRITIASDLLAQHPQAEWWWATSTDAPFESNEVLEAFYSKQLRLLSGESRRLLVFPLDELMAAIQTRVRRDNFRKFVQLHDRQNFELRYWPMTITDLARVVRDLTRSQLAIVDFAVVGNRLVFGQEAQVGDQLSVSGRGRIYNDDTTVNRYVTAFQEIWEGLAGETWPEQQLMEYIKLSEMRSDSSWLNRNIPFSGQAYFDRVVSLIKRSPRLRAIDIAQSIENWLPEQDHAAYQGFLRATIEAAASRGPGGRKAFVGRIYVVRDQKLSKALAGNFAETVLRPQLDSGVKILLLHSTTLVERNLAAVDCILSDDWGFYLMPQERFDVERLCNKDNSIPPDRLSHYAAMFDRLWKTRARSQVLRLSKSSDYDKAAVVKFLFEAKTTPLGPSRKDEK